MKQALLILGSLAIVPFVGAALTTPAIYELLFRLLGEHRWPFSRVFDRVAILFLLLAALWTRRFLDFSAVRPRKFKESLRHGIRPVLLGAAISLAVSTATLPLMVDSRFIWLQRSGLEILGRIAGTLPSAIAIGVLEETFFRGILLFTLMKLIPVRGALLLSSAVYAVVHFIKPLKSFVPESASPLEGLSYLYQAVHQLLAWSVFEGIIGLTLVGLLLGYLFIRTGSLAPSIGLHMGWVLFMKLSLFVTQTTPSAVFAPGVGRRYFFLSEPLGWLSIGVVSVFAIGLFTNLHRSRDGA